jgi:hypothetical protein
LHIPFSSKALGTKQNCHIDIGSIEKTPMKNSDDLKSQRNGKKENL